MEAGVSSAVQLTVATNEMAVEQHGAERSPSKDVSANVSDDEDDDDDDDDDDDEEEESMLAGRTASVGGVGGGGKKMFMMGAVMEEIMLHKNEEDGSMCDDDDDEGEWSFTTHLHKARSTSSHYIVNLPAIFIPPVPIVPMKSIDPNGVFVNCSSTLQLTVCEITVNGLLLTLQVLLPGDICPIVINHSRVYMVATAPINSKIARRNSDHTNSAYSNSTLHLNMCLRLSDALLDNYHKLSVIWIPGTSVSVSRNGRYRRASSSGASNMIGVHTLNYFFQMQVLDRIPQTNVLSS
jgi:hypothetical protein